ncbi:hypothetical protein TNCV_4795271 [Trichonephila clavipes]|nr:hypothetical protein TNCV_4795271 [Trichonephila clavipes]
MIAPFNSRLPPKSSKYLVLGHSIYWIARPERSRAVAANRCAPCAVPVGLKSEASFLEYLKLKLGGMIDGVPL